MAVNKNRRVVVTGMGVLTPIGLTVKEFWDSNDEFKKWCSNDYQF